MHDSTRDGRVRDRIKAVLLASEGWSQTMISQALRIHESTVARHLRDSLHHFCLVVGQCATYDTDRSAGCTVLG